MGINDFKRFLLKICVLSITACLFSTNAIVANGLKSYPAKKSFFSADRDTNYYVNVDENAEFLNGTINEFYGYIDRKLKYPEEEKKNRIEGQVIVGFGVNCFGKIGYVKILRTSNVLSFDNEAIRIVQSSPKWRPAKKGQTYVGQSFTVVVRFKLK